MIKLEYTGLNTNKFHDELNITEKYYVTSKDGVTFIQFPDINLIETPVIVDDEIVDTIITYQKKRVENEITGQDEDGNDIFGDVVYWDEFDFETLQAEIQAVVDVHDPTPYPIKKTELEIMQEIVDNLLIDSLEGV